MKSTRTAEVKRSSHLAIQARRDALKRMRETGEVVTIKLAGGEVVRARSLKDDDIDPGDYVLAIVNKRLVKVWCTATSDGRLRLDRYSIDKKVINKKPKRNRIVGAKQILAVVVTEPEVIEPPPIPFINE
jgi:hypothetical protein